MKRTILLIAIVGGLALVGFSRSPLHGMERLRQWWNGTAQKAPEKPVPTPSVISRAAIKGSEVFPALAAIASAGWTLGIKTAEFIPSLWQKKPVESGIVARLMAPVHKLYNGVAAGIFVGTAGSIILTRSQLLTLLKLALAVKALMVLNELIDKVGAPTAQQKEQVVQLKQRIQELEQEKQDLEQRKTQQQGYSWLPRWLW